MSLEIRIKEICKSKGMTLAKLADAIGVPASSLSQIMRGNPTLSKLQAIAAALDVSPAELFVAPKETTATCPHCGKPIKIRLED